MVRRDITRLLFAGSNKTNHKIPDLFAKYLKRDEIEQFLINKNYTNATYMDDANQNDIHYEAYFALATFIARMKQIESETMDTGESKQLYDDVYKNWENLDYETRNFFTDHVEIRKVVTGGTTTFGARTNLNDARSDLSKHKFKFVTNTCSATGGNCPEILIKLPAEEVNIYGHNGNNLSLPLPYNPPIKKPQNNKDTDGPKDPAKSNPIVEKKTYGKPVEYFSSLLNSVSNNVKYGEYATHLNSKYDNFIGKQLIKSSDVPSRDSVSYPDTDICPSDETKYWKFDVLKGKWYYAMGDKKIFPKEDNDFTMMPRSTCHNLFVNDGYCNDFVNTLLGKARGGSMENFLKDNLAGGDKFTFLPNPLPSTNDYREMEPHASRKIAKSFGYQKVRVTASGYERVQTVQEWFDSRVDNFFKDPDVKKALKDPQNSHVHTFLAHCVCRANTLYKALPLNQKLAVMYSTHNSLIKPFYGECFEMVGGGYTSSCDKLKQFLEATRYQSGGGTDSTGGLLSHYMKLNNEKYPNLSTNACKYLESRSEKIESLWDHAFDIVDKTSYNRGYLISDHIKRKILDDIAAHKKLTSQLTTIVCSLEGLANVENSSALHEARSKGFIQAGGQPDVNYENFKHLARKSYENMRRVNSKLKDTDKRLRGLFLRILDMMASEEVEELEE